MATSGPKAGWIFKHDARLGSPESITISRGEIFEERDGRTRYRRNVEDYALDLNLWEWKRLTNRNWRQFFIRQENNRLFVLDRRLQPDSLVPSSIDSSSVQTLKWNRIAFKLNDVSIELTVGIGQIEIIVQGELSPETSARLTERSPKLPNTRSRRDAYSKADNSRGEPPWWFYRLSLQLQRLRLLPFHNVR